ncbi:hypothetical protein OUZ56_010467 [Daphnia magna]|uniref:Uncharacterized protein n=1 Tax=Daphnia magna TaxID=35525 RepID=A0ABR0AJ23_9CRUS|nr:hypothetical protein OUZ56_010467 [Daphnia magna]
MNKLRFGAVKLHFIVSDLSQIKQCRPRDVPNTSKMYLEHTRFPSLHSLDVFYVLVMSASPRSHTRTYLIPLDRPWTSFGWNWDVNGTSEMRNKRLVFK